MNVASFKNAKVWVNKLFMSYKTMDFFLLEPCFLKVKLPSYLILNCLSSYTNKTCFTDMKIFSTRKPAGFVIPCLNQKQ